MARYVGSEARRPDGKYVYIRSETFGWVPAIQLKVQGPNAVVAVPAFGNEQNMMSCGKQQKYHNSQVIDLKDYPNGILPMQNVDADGKLEDYKDMVHLPFLHEAAILYNLKLRHTTGKPYTRTGDIVIAVNPYQWLSELYTDNKRKHYANRLVWDKNDDDPRKTVEPHIYEVSSLSYKGLVVDGEDQSILVSGESGAGKTETVKLCLSHIASVQQQEQGSHNKEDPVVTRIVGSNPLLEAFGNAKTCRNDNSSRFGKYLQLQFDTGNTIGNGSKASTNHGFSAKATLVGSKCEVYLLEKSRVVRHEIEERNFHIFYQLLAAPNSDKTRFWSGLKGTNNESFTYVGYTDTNVIEGSSDAEGYRKTIKALELIGVHGPKLDTLMQAICIVLQLGNIGFEELNGNPEHSAVGSQDELASLASLMGLSEQELTVALTERSFRTRKDSHKVPLNPEMAQDACDALAKEIYQKAFLWLVNEANDATRGSENDGQTFGTIGLLDIFGFETFEVNRFEQLCINYANEKLQQKFTEDIFKNVQAEYIAEGISLEDIWYDDNTEVLDLIEGPTGLLNMLNEECILPKGNDQAFVQKALQKNKDSPALMVNRLDRMSFGIRHYAGSVLYDAELFVNKNIDLLPTDLQLCAEKSTNEIVRQNRSEPAMNRRRIETTAISRKNRKENNDAFAAPSPPSSRRESNLVASTVWGKYKGQLKSLMINLRKTKSRYIRCIKPNSVKKPFLMEHSIVVDQLRHSGIIAGVTIARSVFPNSLPNSVVLARYYRTQSCGDRRSMGSTSPSSLQNDQSRADLCRAMLTSALKEKESITVDNNGVQRYVKAFVVGKTRTYFRSGAYEWLESNRISSMDSIAVIIQTAIRGWLARNRGQKARQRKREEVAAKKKKKQEEEQRKIAMKKQQEYRVLEHEREAKRLRDEIDKLKRKTKDDNLSTENVMAEITDRKESVRQDIEELQKKRLDEQEASMRRTLAQQNAKIEEAKKIIEFLKVENKRARKENLRIKDRLCQMKDNSSKLQNSFSSLEDSVYTNNAKAKKEASTFDHRRGTFESVRLRNKELREQVDEMQAKYLEQAKRRLDMQMLMSSVLTVIQDKCRNANIVEDIVIIALKCEAEGKSLMAGVEAETSIPSLVASDASESTEQSMSWHPEDSERST